ncbi:MAG: restriction endonuclease subunit S, partial [Erythrobacteraceae bacterium]|nr:restriction endonuclease subunit S [Erythrobacteraceae bacterium]
MDQLQYMTNTTTIDVIYSESLKDVLLVVPSLNEQSAIAAFLDRETTSIDALVAKKERLIELL